jgi:hypothetical protein
VHNELTKAGATDAEINKITFENACRFFDFDPFVYLDRPAATVGALRSRATDVDVSETSRAVYRERYFQNA